jgi:pyruvate ferredoxin oxidoreductase delta subunit
MSADAKAGAKGPAAKKPKWDISDIDTWGPDKHELGSLIPEAGNSIYNETGSWGTETPIIDTEKCDGCMLCYFYCPDAAIVVEDGKAVSSDLEYCKGCGICAKECPRDAITMTIKEQQVIDESVCIQCGECSKVCRYEAIEVD